MTTKEYGAWLADQEWRYRLHAAGLPEIYVSGSEEFAIAGCDHGFTDEELAEAFKLMTYAPRMLRFTLRALEIIKDGHLKDYAKLDHLETLLEEIANNVLHPHKMMEVANAVEYRQSTVGEEEEDED